MKFSLPLRSIALLLVFVVGPRMTHAAAPEPQVVLSTAVDEFLSVAYDKAPTDKSLSQRVRPVLEKYFDFTGITRRAIGPGWRGMSPEQRKKATSLFSELVIRTYADRFDPAGRPTVTYAKPVQLSPTRRELPQTVSYAGKNYAVAYRMEQQPSGNWLIYDVVIEGVSMISNYRAQFEAILQKSGADGLLRSLQESLTKLETKKA